MFEFNLGVQGIIRLQVFREGNLISDTSHKNDSTEALTRLSNAYGNPASSGSSAASAIGKIKVGYPAGQYTIAGDEVVSVSNPSNGVAITSTTGSGTVTTTCGGFDDIACPQNGYLDISLLDTTDAVISHRLATNSEGVQVTVTSGIAKGDTVIITYTLTITGLHDQAAHVEAATFFKDPSTINGAAAMRFNAMGIYTNSGQTTKLAFPDSTNTGSGQTDADGFTDADQGPVLGTIADGTPKPIKMQRSISALTQTPYGAWIDNSQGTVIKTGNGAMGWDPANSGRRHTFLFVTRFTGA